MGREVIAAIAFAVVCIAILITFLERQRRWSQLDDQERREFYRRFEKRLLQGVEVLKLQEQMLDLQRRLADLEKWRYDTPDMVANVDRPSRSIDESLSEDLDPRELLSRRSVRSVEPDEVEPDVTTPHFLNLSSMDPGVQEIVRKFLSLCDEGFFDFATATEWFRQELPTATLEPIGQSSPEDWALISIQLGSRAFIVPAIRRPMGGVRLEEYFELQNYNGMDALRANFIVEIPELRRQAGRWVVARQGRIHAH